MLQLDKIRHFELLLRSRSLGFLGYGNNWFRIRVKACEAAQINTGEIRISDRIREGKACMGFGAGTRKGLVALRFHLDLGRLTRFWVELSLVEMSVLNCASGFRKQLQISL